MKQGKSLGAVACVTALLLALSGLSGCQKHEGAAEKAGKEIDKAAEQAGEKIKEGTQKLGQELEKAGEKIQDAATKRDEKRDEK